MFCLFLTQDWGGGGNIIFRLNQDRMDHMKFLVSLGANVGKHELMWGDHIRNHFHFVLQIWESHKYLEIRVTNIVSFGFKGCPNVLECSFEIWLLKVYGQVGVHETAGPYWPRHPRFVYGYGFIVRDIHPFQVFKHVFLLGDSTNESKLPKGLVFSSSLSQRP